MGDWNPVGITSLRDDDQTTSPWSKSIASGGTNTKGSYGVLAASAPANTVGIMLFCQSNNGAYFLADLALGGAGSEQIVIPNLGISSASQGSIVPTPIFIPLLIPAGSRVSMRVQCSNGTLATLVKILFIAGSFSGIIGRSPSRYEDWGADTANSFGTAITAGNAAKSAYTQLKAATGISTRWVSLEMESVTANSNQATIDLAVGGAGAEQVVIPDITFTNGCLGSQVVLPLQIPQGSRIAARVASSSGTPSVKIHAHGGGA